MLKPLLLCSSFFLVVGVFAGEDPPDYDTNYSISVHSEPMYSLMKAYPACAAKFLSNETEAKIEKCAPNLTFHNKTDSASCCSTMEALSCTRAILWSMPECKGVRFGFDLSIEEMKFVASKCNGTNCINVGRNVACPIVPLTGTAVKGILENIFLPLAEVLAKHRDCSQSISEQWIPCYKPFDPIMLSGHTFQHPDALLCSSQWSSLQCFRGLIEKEPKCQDAKSEFESAFAQMKEKVTKKGCPLKL